MATNLGDLLNEYMGQEKLTRTDGEKGVQNLCKILNALGYHDKQYFGQFQGGSYGSLIMFLEDNPGAVEAITNWVAEENVDEWAEAIESCLDEKEDE